jgi:plasmid segregation protein ParM
MKVVGIDIGYGFLKVTDGLEHFVIPSVIGNAVDLTFDMGYTQKDLTNIRISVDGEEYFVGELAIEQSDHPYRSLSVDRTTDTVTKVMFLTSLAMTTEHPIESFKVVTGLPVKDFTMYKQTYIDKFTGTHEIFLHGEKRLIHIEKVIVVPQPYGSFCDGLFTAEGEIDEDFAENHVGIIDIGYGTSDFIQVKNYRYLERFSSTSANGISSIYRDIANYLSTHHSIHKEDFELEEIIRTGELKIRGGSIDISEPLKSAKRSLAKKVGNEIKSMWSNLPEVSLIIVAGGGGALLYDELTEILGDDIVLADNSQLANVRGYRNWGVYLEGEE